MSTVTCRDCSKNLKYYLRTRRTIEEQGPPSIDPKNDIRKGFFV